MSEREVHRRAGQRDDQTELDEPDAGTGTAAAPSAQDESLTEDVDAILDEIDDVLEENAAEFVQGFVQKGGQ